MELFLITSVYTAPMGQCYCARHRAVLSKHTCPVWPKDSVEGLTPPLSQREQGLPSLKPGGRISSTRVIFGVVSLAKGPRHQPESLKQVEVAEWPHQGSEVRLGKPASCSTLE